ncbi:hypothetical protein CHARACLAT_029190 [Characodon lateralis]|uniref:Uncharacterized protein n=1 Tax=Characodon lateralis TaxID=208331 RepID=A0ABU7CSZ6_9TELE|nr:hypothetical protein [Characodon lateralis]
MVAECIIFPWWSKGLYKTKWVQPPSSHFFFVQISEHNHFSVPNRLSVICDWNNMHKCGQRAAQKLCKPLRDGFGTGGVFVCVWIRVTKSVINKATAVIRPR